MNSGTLDDFTQAYITAALWSSTDDDGTPLDSNYDENDIAPATLDTMQTDCHRFWNDNKRNIIAATHLGDYVKNNHQYCGAELAGHDFWLTRCHHGAGFWDRGLGELGRLLTDAAHVYGNVDLYIGDDGKVHS